MVYSSEILSYVAGLFDGEGSIVIAVVLPNAKRGNISPIHCLRVTLGMTHQETIQWLHNIFGGHVTQNGNGTHARHPLFLWSVVANQAQSFLELIYPYLRYKKEQATIAIEFQKARKGRSSFRLTNETVSMREKYRTQLRQLTNGVMNLGC